MKRSIFDVLPDFEGKKEFIDSVMSENGKDIENAKAGSVAVQGELDTAKAKIDELQSTIDEMSKSVGDMEAMKATIKKYEEAEAERVETEKQAIFEKNMQDRFTGLVGSSEFVNDFTRAGAYEAFKKAVADERNAGKGDKDIYAEVIKGNENWFKSQQNFVDIQGVQHIDQSLVDVEAFKKMTLTQRMGFANAHPQEYSEISKLL